MRKEKYGGSRHGLEIHQLSPKDSQWNLGRSQLVEQAVCRQEGRLSAHGALVVETGRHTGRSANDKFTVKNAASESTVDWGKVNIPMTQQAFDRLHADFIDHLNTKSLYVQDLWGGADHEYRLPVRVVTETAWHSLFARTMLIVPQQDEYADFLPDYTILHSPSFKADVARHETRSETVVAVDLQKKLVLIGGTAYAGEIKKSVFSILNFLLPQQGVMPMHSSANIGEDGKVAIFFGLSGTGKTTLSADPARQLIGDDEHGWSDNGVFNFEGGCYAKMIRLSQEAEPEIFATTRKFGTIIENVVMDDDKRTLDFDDNSLAENTRGAYPVDFIPNHCEANRGGAPSTIIMLTADAFGILPPIARLTPDQAMYHFLSGYTAKVAGTEIGVKEPQATFSACFGAPFMPRHPSVYGDLLRQRIAKGGVSCWLVNTGWTGGVYGVGERMPIKVTRALLNAALDGSLDKVDMRKDKHFGFMVPVHVPGVPDEILDPRSTWSDGADYDEKAAQLVHLFTENFQQFEGHVDKDVLGAAPKSA